MHVIFKTLTSFRKFAFISNFLKNEVMNLLNEWMNLQKVRSSIKLSWLWESAIEKVDSTVKYTVNFSILMVLIIFKNTQENEF